MNKNILKTAEPNGYVAESDSGIWSAGIDLYGQDCAIQIHRGTEQEAVELRDYLLLLIKNAKHKEDPEAWREEYRKKHAAGVKFEYWENGASAIGVLAFKGKKENYREVVETSKPTIPHLAERKLWLAQREAGTDEVWQVRDSRGDGWKDVCINDDLWWIPSSEYRMKPCTEKRYMALFKNGNHPAYAFLASSTEEIQAHAEWWGIPIIGDIVEREVEL